MEGPDTLLPTVAAFAKIAAPMVGPKCGGRDLMVEI